MNPLTSTDRSTRERRDLALAVIAAAQLMVMLDLTITNVALPSIQHSLHFSTTSCSEACLWESFSRIQPRLG